MSEKEEIQGQTNDFQKLNYVIVKGRKKSTK